MRRSSGVDEKRAVVLLSGGLDSATCLAVACAEGFAAHALSVRYGQRHAVELECARRLAEAWGAREHRLIEVGLGELGGSALTSDIPVPKDGVAEGRIPATYVPARNTLLLALALAYAETAVARDVFIGVNALDYSGYPDCRPEFIEAFQRAAELGTKAGCEGAPIRIRAPLIGMTKAEIIRKGVELGVDYGMTSSCYDPGGNGAPCGECDSCRLRAKGFEEAGIPDPLDCRSWPDSCAARPDG